MTDKPRHTRIPNAILDSMADLTEPELRVLLIITRKTIGWQKECDLISLTQLEKLTGLSRPAVNKALHTAIERGWVECTGRGKQNTGCYKLTSELVNDVNQLTEITSKQGLPASVNVVNRSAPELVNDVNTQKKDLKKDKERDGSRAARPTPPPKQTNLDSFNEAVSIFKELSGKKQITPALTTLIATRVTDMSVWRATIESWASCGYNVMNIKDMLDWYDHPEKMAAKMGYNNGLGSNQAQSGRMVHRNGHRPANADIPSRPASSGQAEYERQYLDWASSDDETDFIFKRPDL